MAQSNEMEAIAKLLVVIREVIATMPPEARRNAQQAYNSALTSIRDDNASGNPTMKMIPLMNEDDLWPWPWLKAKKK